MILYEMYVKTVCSYESFQCYERHKPQHQGTPIHNGSELSETSMNNFR